MRTFVLTLAAVLLCGITLITLAIVWGGPQPIASIAALDIAKHPEL